MSKWLGVPWCGTPGKDIILHKKYRNSQYYLRFLFALHAPLCME